MNGSRGDGRHRPLPWMCRCLLVPLGDSLRGELGRVALPLVGDAIAGALARRDANRALLADIYGCRVDLVDDVVAYADRTIPPQPAP